MSDARSDADLIMQARAGDEEAYAEIYRRHSSAALRFARSLGRPDDAEDLVSEAFVRVLAAIKSGNGPEEAFRPYLLSAVRNAFYDSARRAAKERAVDDLTPLAPEVPFIDPVMEKEESRLVATAFGELPERWQAVLWHTEVEGETPAQVAPLLGISANAVAALAYRAREGLRERYLHAHLGSTTDETCRPVTERLAAFTRGKLSRAEKAKVKAHLDGCSRCSLLFVSLADVNSRLGALIGPVVVGGAASGYVAGSVANVASAGGSMFSLLRRLGRRRDAQLGAGATATVAAVAVVLTTLVPGPASQAPGTADPPSGRPPSTALPADPSATPGPSGAAVTSTGSEPAPGATVSEPGAAVTLTATLEPVGSLVRGSLGVLALTVHRPLGGTQSTGTITATFSLPAGVTLRGSGGGSAGGGWTCGENACTRAALAAGETTRAYVPIAVSAGAAGGPASVELTGTGVASTSAATSTGVGGAGLGAVFATTGAVSVVAGGNTLLSCPLLLLGCSWARDGHGINLDNNGWLMVPYVAPGAPSGAPAASAVSGASIALPGTVLWAGLYWAGTGTAPAQPTAYVRPPGASGYQAVTARRVDQVPATGSDKAMYQATADITGLASSGTGTWWVAVPTNAFSSGLGAFAGWGLLAVVASGGSTRTVAVYDAVQVMRSGGDAWSSTVYGSPDGAATVAFIAWEGDRGQNGDTMTLGSGALGSPSNNIARSQTDGTPSGWNTFGTDARVVSGMLGHSNSPTLTVGTNGDTWLLGALALATPTTPLIEG